MDWRSCWAGIPPDCRGRSLVEQELVEPGTSRGCPPAFHRNYSVAGRYPSGRTATHRRSRIGGCGESGVLPSCRSRGDRFESAALLNLFEKSNRTWFFGPAGALPIFNAGAIRPVYELRKAPSGIDAHLPADGTSGVSRSGGFMVGLESLRSCALNRRAWWRAFASRRTDRPRLPGGVTAISNISTPNVSYWMPNSGCRKSAG